MKTLKIIIIFLSMLFLFSCTQEEFPSKFSFSPEKPKAGDVVTVKYKPELKEFINAENIEMIIHQYSKDLDLTETKNLSKKGLGYVGSFTVTDSTRGVIIRFSSNENFDNNEKLGYIINVYNESGSKVPGSNAGLAAVYIKWGGALELEVDKNKVLSLMEEDFKPNPQIKTDYLETYFYSLPKSIVDSIIQIELESLEEKENLRQSDLEFLTNWHDRIQNKVKAEKYKEILLSKYPNSVIAQRDYFMKFRAENDLDKKLELLRNFTNLYPKSDFIKSMLSLTTNQFAKLGNYDKASEVLREFPQFASSDMYNNLAWSMFENNKNLELASELCIKGIEIGKGKLNNLEIDKPVYLTNRQWRGINERSLGFLYDTYAGILNKLGDRENALINYEESVKLTAGKDAEINENYVSFLINLEKYEEAKVNLEKFLSSGANTDNMKNMLKDVYEKLGIENSKATEALSKFEADAEEKLIDKIQKEIISKPAPKFSLTDLNGKAVNLDDYKGQTVVLDFWATWCGPCVESFPGMQKAINNYSNDSKVKFLFINTWENVDDKKKNAADFINKNNYTFLVLLDDKNEVIEKYEVRGIPTKFIIDKNQNIRFISVGYGGKEDELVAELDAMISLIQ